MSGSLSSDLRDLFVNAGSWALAPSPKIVLLGDGSNASISIGSPGDDCESKDGEVPDERESESGSGGDTILICVLERCLQH